MTSEPVQAGTSRPEHASRSVQTDPGSPTRRVRKNLFSPHLRTLATFPPRDAPATIVDHLVVDTTRARRLCDCAVCVAHNLRLLQNDVQGDPPAEPGVRYVRLPLQCPISDRRDRSALDRILRLRPRATFVVCGCVLCAAHRNLLQALVEALKITPTTDGAVPPPTGRRMSRHWP